MSPELRRMSSIPAHFNFAKAIGIESLAGAIVFTILYVFLLAWFLRQPFTHPTYVHYILTVFCTSKQAHCLTKYFHCGIQYFSTSRRVCHLAASKTSGESLGLVIADEVLFGVGYFSLLYSAYILVLDR